MNLPPTRASLDAYVAMLNGAGLPWMVGVLWGDVLVSGLAESALKTGGHIRVGLEDFAGPEQPTNEELVERAVQLGAKYGRKTVGTGDVEAALWG